MKIVGLATLLMVCGFTTSVKAQKISNPFQTTAALNFIENISFTAAGKFITPVKNEEDDAVEAIGAIEKFSAIQFKYAMMMDVDVESISSEAVYGFIDEWYGTRYRMGGTTKKGIDCSAFSGALLSSIYSFSIPRTAHEQYKASERVGKENLLTGDLVFFNTTGGVSHVGVYLTNNRFVHSCCSKGVTISSLDEPYYASKFISGGRINQ